MTESQSYEITARNRVVRRSERAHYDRETVHAILDSSMLCHIAYQIDGQPFCTPITFWRRDETLYWHGSAASRMLRSQIDKVEVCVTVALLDELVLTRSAFGHSVNYRAAMVFGRAQLVNDLEETRQAAADLLDKFYPGRSQIVRPPALSELKQTKFIKMPIEQASAKIRKLPASAEPEADHDSPVWAGIIPLSFVVGEAVACEKLVPGVQMGTDLAAFRPGAKMDEILRRSPLRD